MAAEAIVSGILRSVSYQAASFALTQYKLLSAAEEEVEKLKITVSLLQSFLTDVERRRVGESKVKIWLQTLQAVAYDAEDILDELNTEALRLGVHRTRTSWIRLVGDFILSCFTCSAQVPILFNYQIARRIKFVRERLDLIVKDGRNLGFHESIAGQSQPAGVMRPWRESSSLGFDSEVVGRSKEKETLIKLLLPSVSGEASSPVSDELNFEVASIFGMGGLGKTTLARAVYNDGMVKARFKLRIWVPVSGNLSATALLSDIIESVSEKRPNLTLLDNLQTNLAKLLHDKLFLLVLDDVWSQQTVWNALRVPLSYGRYGSRVIITSRNQTSALPPDIRTTSINLGALTFESCWSIFQRFTYVEGTPLEMVGREIVKKARGVPLVAKALGSLVNSFGLNEHRWRSILNDDLPQSLDDEMNIVSILRLSYDHLPVHLKQCFAFCAIFPKGHVFNKNVMVNMWMALGFVQVEGGQRMEDIGSDYFDDLLRRSFYDHFQSGQYRMHDFMHTLAKSVSGDECFSIPGGDLADPCKVRHLSVTLTDSKWLKDLHKFTKLRSLVFLKQYDALSVQHLGDLFKKLKTLRVLDLSCVTRLSGSDNLLGSLQSYFLGDYLKEFPKSIGFLKLLRYLDLSVNDIRKLPGSLGTLFNLQMLSLKDCKKHFILPSEMVNLVNLRHFDVDAFQEFYQISAVGKLTALQELRRFSVGRTAGSKIGELKLLNELRGKLSISNIENVMYVEEARDARLDDKQYIDSLELEWNRGEMNSKLHEQVLDILKPHISLKDLVIRNYGGIRSPRWLQNLSLPFLESVHLIGCQWWKVLPPLGRLQFLKVLVLSGMDGRGQQGCFEFFDDGKFDGVWFPQLCQLRIWSTLRLSHFPNLPPSLTDMYIDTLGFKAEMTTFKRSSRTGFAPSSSAAAAAADKTLRIWQMGDLDLNWGCILQHHLWALKELSIKNCGRLATLSLEGFSSLSLRKLSITNCMVLTQLPPLPSALQELKLHKVGLSNLPAVREVSSNTVAGSSNEISSPSIMECPSLSFLEISDWPRLSCICEGLLNQNLRVFKKLIIHDCCKLKSFPKMGFESLVSLEYLDISACSKLNELPSLPPGLMFLGLDRLGLRALPEFLNFSSMSPSLRKVEISECPELASLCKGLLQQDVRALEELFICHCEKLECLPGPGQFTSLKVLTIVMCPKLLFVSNDKMPATLTTLEIEGCPLLMKQYEAAAGNSSWPNISCPDLRHIGNRWHRTSRAKPGIFTALFGIFAFTKISVAGTECQDPKENPGHGNGNPGYFPMLFSIGLFSPLE